MRSHTAKNVDATNRPSPGVFASMADLVVRSHSVRGLPAVSRNLVREDE